VFDAVALIVRALVDSLLSDLTDQAVRSAYAAIRNAIVGYGHGPAASLEELEKQPSSLERQAQLSHELKLVGADKDSHLVGLANELVNLLHRLPEPIQDDPLVDVRRNACMQAVSQALEDHVDRILTLRSERPLEPSDMSSAHLGLIKDLPQGIRQQLTGVGATIREVIELTASYIEEAGYEDLEQLIADPQIGYAERQRAKRLVEADKRVRVSCRSATLTLEFFSYLNKTLLEKIERESEGTRQRNLMLGNAILVSEVCDFSIQYIEGLDPAILGELERIYGDAKDEIVRLRQRQAKLAEDVEHPKIEAVARKRILLDVESRSAALDRLEDAWEAYIGDVKQVGPLMEEIRQVVPTLEAMRENAELQKVVLTHVLMLNFLESNLASLKAITKSATDFRLAPLSPNRLRQLLDL
jgi:hypothetical protein